MSKFKQQIDTALAGAERQAILEQLRANPNMTVADLFELAKTKGLEQLRTVTIGEIIGVAAPKSAGSSRTRPPKTKAGWGEPLPAFETEKAPKPKKAEKTPKKVGSVDVRTPEGRKAYDAKILAAIGESGEPIGAEQLRPKVGGAPTQLRAGLNRLCESGQIVWSGKARGMKYSLPDAE